MDEAQTRDAMQGPLAGIRIVEFHGLGPGPFAGMLLADMGADVLRITRHGGSDDSDFDTTTSRNRNVLTLDLKQDCDAQAALALCCAADVLIEGFRPGVMERLGLGPDAVRAKAPGLVYARMTGWGQEGPLARAAGHDINYIALSGALAAIGTEETGPLPPLNLVGDYGGGALYLVMGILAALIERAGSGEGQVVDCAMCDGVTSLMSAFYDMRAHGRWNLRRSSNLLDGAAPFYCTYECADGRYIAVGAIELPFWHELCRRVGLNQKDAAARDDTSSWPRIKASLAGIFRQRTQAEWCALLENGDTCVSPVLDLDEAALHPHMRARAAFVDVGGSMQPSPSPRFSRTPLPRPSVARPLVPAEALKLWNASVS